MDISIIEVNGKTCDVIEYYCSIFDNLNSNNFVSISKIQEDRYVLEILENGEITLSDNLDAVSIVKIRHRLIILGSMRMDMRDKFQEGIISFIEDEITRNIRIQIFPEDSYRVLEMRYV